ncbi:MAG TPA: glycosyltransferase family 1 protein [Thermomicrobiaceae bacterium]|nr:glycosyltransferase family 1 protein [Thermomicrobiaceae bacterium]
MIGRHETGNETYVVELTRALGNLGLHDYLLYAEFGTAVPGRLTDALAVAIRRVRATPSPLRLARLYPRLLAQDGVALAHFTYITPPRSPCPVVVTVHDLSFRRYPEFFSPRVRLVLGLLLGSSLRRARHVLTLSKCSQRDIVHFYNIPPDRITTTSLAAGDQFRPRTPDEIRAVRHRYGLAERYVLAVGNVQPRKNLPRLVDAFAAVAGEVSDLQLVIAGQSAWKGSDTEAAVTAAGVQDRVRFTGYVPDCDLPALYSGAAIFSYPSLYEGFGLPALEAMACGTATITSDRSSLPEVVGDAALTVDPTSTADLAGAIHALISDETLQSVYSRRGLSRAGTFSWAATARATAAIYDRVIAQG